MTKKFLITLLLILFHINLSNVFAQIDVKYSQKNAEAVLPSSPYKIKKLAQKGEVNVKTLWDKLNIVDDAFEIVRDIQIDIFPVSLKGKKSDSALLIFNNFVAERCRFVLFSKSRKNLWRTIGYVDVDNLRYDIPKHRIIKTKNHKWLVLKEQIESGSGIAVYQDNWYEIKKGNFESRLKYVSKGHEFFGQIMDREFAGKILDYSDKQVSIEYKVDWNSYTNTELSENEIMFSDKKTVVFSWNKQEKRFNFDRSKSQITQQYQKDIFGIQNLNQELYLKYNYANLRKIARFGTSKKKDWLRKSLEKLYDSEIKYQLLDTLN